MKQEDSKGKREVWSLAVFGIICDIYTSVDELAADIGMLVPYCCTIGSSMGVRTNLNAVYRAIIWESMVTLIRKWPFRVYNSLFLCTYHNFMSFF